MRTPLPLALVVTLILSGCSSPGRTVVRSDPSAGLPPPTLGQPGPEQPRLPYGTQGPVVAGRIPPDLVPPVGQCRVWMPGLAPADQPDPALCSRVKAHVPLGALLVQTPRAGIVEITTFDDLHPDLVVMVARYDSATGELLGSGVPGE